MENIRPDFSELSGESPKSNLENLQSAPSHNSPIINKLVNEIEEETIKKYQSFISKRNTFKDLSGGFCQPPQKKEEDEDTLKKRDYNKEAYAHLSNAREKKASGQELTYEEQYFLEAEEGNYFEDVVYQGVDETPQPQISEEVISIRPTSKEIAENFKEFEEMFGSEKVAGENDGSELRKKIDEIILNDLKKLGNPLQPNLNAFTEPANGFIHEGRPVTLGGEIKTINAEEFLSNTLNQELAKQQLMSQMFGEVTEQPNQSVINNMVEWLNRVQESQSTEFETRKLPDMPYSHPNPSMGEEPIYITNPDCIPNMTIDGTIEKGEEYKSYEDGTAGDQCGSGG